MSFSEKARFYLFGKRKLRILAENNTRSELITFRVIVTDDSYLYELISSADIPDTWDEHGNHLYGELFEGTRLIR
jgi:hypothetical protein